MLLAITVPFIAFANVLRTQYIIPSEKDKVYLLSVALGALVNIVMNWLMIPHFNAIGAILGTICAEVMVCVVQAIAVRKELPIKSYIKNCIYFILVGIAMLFIVYQIGINMKTSVLTLILQVISGVVFYATFCLIYFVKTKDELFMRMLSKILIKIK